MFHLLNNRKVYAKNEILFLGRQIYDIWHFICYNIELLHSYRYRIL